MSRRGLLSWSRTVDDRQRRARHLPSAWLLGTLASIAAAAESLRRYHLQGESPANAQGLFLIVLSVVVLWNMFAAPYRLYWRSDSMLLARLPISGREMFKTAWWRSASSALTSLAPFAVFAVVAIGVVPVTRLLAWLAVVVFGAICALALAPACTLFAGVITSSATTQAALASVIKRSAGDRVEVPAATWMGLLPGLAGTAFVVGIVAVHAWLDGRATSAALILVAAIAGTALLLLAATTRISDATLTQAVRDMAALDRQRLAHVDRSTASVFERLWAALVSRNARVIMNKDFQLARRRYPLPYALAAGCLVVVWVCAAIGGSQAFSVSIGALSALQLSAIAIARRLWEAPIEQARLLTVLPLPRRAQWVAKRGHAMLRSVTGSALAVGPLCVRYPYPERWIPLTIGCTLAALLCGWLVGRSNES